MGYRSWLWGAVLLLGLAVLFQIFWWEEHRTHQAEAQALAERDWGAYLTNYYALSGSWQGLQRRLEIDVPRYRPQDALSLRVQGIDPMSLYTFGPQREAADHLLLWEGKPIGTYQVVLRTNPVLTPIMWGVQGGALAFACVCFVVGVRIAVARPTARLRKVENRLQDLVKRKTETRADQGSENEKLESLMDQLEARLTRLEKVRKTMVADFAHELRTPLTVMRSQLDNVLSEGQCMSLEKAALLNDEVYRMTKLVNDLLQLVLAESGQLPLERSWFSFSKLLQRVVGVLEFEAMEEGRDIVLRIEGVMQLYADQNRVQQVLINLIGNAIRHAHSRIEVVASADEQQILVSIQDDGTGIEAEDIPYLFDRFYRGRKQGRKQSGLGLGLAIVKEYVQAHGGTVSVQSQWGEGSTFQVKLPIFSEF